MGAGTFILAAGYAKTATVAVTCMCIGVASSGLMHSGYNVNMLDIAPRYACVIMGLTNTVGTVTGFLSPMMVGYITVDKVGIKQNETNKQTKRLRVVCNVYNYDAAYHLYIPPFSYLFTPFPTAIILLLNFRPIRMVRESLTGS